MRSNQKPDTLTQDGITQVDENLLHRTAGPYIGVILAQSAAAARRSELPQYSESGGQSVRPLTASRRAA